MKYIEPDKIVGGVTPSEVYSEGILTKGAPEGYEFTGKLIYPLRGDLFLNTLGHAEESSINSFRHVNLLRLELRKVKRKQIIFTEIRRESQPQRGEWYSAHLGRGGVRQWEGAEPRKAMDMGDFCTIFKREDREV